MGLKKFENFGGGIKDKDKLLKFFNTLFWSGGSEPQAEVIWAANEMLEWMESEFGVTINERFTEDDRNAMNFNAVIDEISNL